MTDRERILAILRGDRPDRVPWCADLDYWYTASLLSGSLPGAYRGADGRVRLTRDLGAGFYLQGYFPFREVHADLSVDERRDGDQVFRTIRTPAGDLTSVDRFLPTSFSWGTTKHLVETADDLPAFLHYYRQLRVEPDFDEARRRREWIGEDGVVLVYTPRSPFMQLATTFMGVENLVYLLLDEPDTMAELLDLMERRHDEAAELAVAAPADCVMIPENLSSEVVGDTYYRQYLRPYENRWIRRIREAGAYSFIHMDGTLRGLLSEVAETGFDVIEAVTPLPCGDLAMADILARVPGPTILWGGLPGALLTPSATEEEFTDHVVETLALLRREPRFVLGVADQVPPDGLPDRVRRVRELCDGYGRYD